MILGNDGFTLGNDHFDYLDLDFDLSKDMSECTLGDAKEILIAIKEEDALRFQKNLQILTVASHSDFD